MKIKYTLRPTLSSISNVRLMVRLMDVFTKELVGSNDGSSITTEMLGR